MENLEKIENYLSGTLTESERLNYENELKNNSELRDLQLKYILAKEAVVSAGIREQVAKVHKDFMQNRIQNQEIHSDIKPKGKQVFMLSSTMRIAASVLIFLLAYSTYQYTTLSPRKVLDGMTIAYNPSTLRGGGDNYAQVRSAFERKDYKKVIATTQDKTTKDVDLIFFRALANFNLENYADALRDFEALKQQNARSLKPSFVYEIAYYEALSLVGAEKFELAVDKLKGVQANKQNPYHVAISDWDILKIKLLH